MATIKEFFKRTVEATSKFGMGLSYKEEKITNSLKGEFFIKLNHSDGRVEEKHIHNIIVEDASLLIARLLADGQTSIDPAGPSHGIFVMALGTGNPAWPDKNNPPAPTIYQHILEAELARKRFSNVSFVKTDGSGLPASVVTNIVDFQAVFNESEAVGPITELCMFGGDALDTLADSGTMLNYRTIPVINKPNTATLSIIFRITT